MRKRLPVATYSKGIDRHTGESGGSGEEGGKDSELHLVQFTAGMERSVRR
jgi:hypothetical protein